MHTNKSPQNTVLVALVREPSDFHILREERWYRIPVEHAPGMVKTGAIQYLAFYFPAAFGPEAASIRWYGKVKHIEIAGRRDLFPFEPSNAKSGRTYYKITIEALLPLPQPILSHCPRRILFVPTTEARFFHLPKPDLNYLFNDSPLENLLWERLLLEDIPAERQYELIADGRRWILDFAILCQLQALAIECDGDAWHTSPMQVKRDKQRDNSFISKGWSLLRYTADDLRKDMTRVVFQIRDNVGRLGGVRNKYT